MAAASAVAPPGAMPVAPPVAMPVAPPGAMPVAPGDAVIYNSPPVFARTFDGAPSPEEVVGVMYVVTKVKRDGNIEFMPAYDPATTGNKPYIIINPICDLFNGKLLIMKDAARRHWVARWYWFHPRRKWQMYKPSDAAKIEAAYVAGENSLLLSEGGKFGHGYQIDLPRLFNGEPVSGSQTSESSGKVYPIRRQFFRVVDLAAKPVDWCCLQFPHIDPSIVALALEETAATLESVRPTLEEMDAQAEYHGYAPEDPRRFEWEPTLLQMTQQWAQVSGCPEVVVVWEWWHRSGWLPYAGYMSALIEERYGAGKFSTMLVGAKPTTERRSSPLQITYHAPYSNGLMGAPHSQVDLVTQNTRGVRRCVYERPSKDAPIHWARKYLLACLLQGAPHVVSKTVVKEYETLLGEMDKVWRAGEFRPHDFRTRVRRVQKTLQDLEAASTLTPPEQEPADESFFCAISHELMLYPVYPKKNPRAARCERSQLLRWLKISQTHPITREVVMGEADLVIDEDMQAALIAFYDKFA